MISIVKGKTEIPHNLTDASGGFFICQLLFAYNASDGPGKELWVRLDRQQLAVKASYEQNIRELALLFSRLADLDAEAADTFCRLVDMRALAKKVDSHEGVVGVGECLRAVYEARFQSGEKLWNSLDLKALALKLKRAW